MNNFYTLNREKLDLTVIDFKQNTDSANEIYIELVLAVSYAFFKRVEAESFFNYHALIRNNEIDTFQNEKSIELRIRLRSNFVKTLNEANYSDTEIRNAMENEEAAFLFLNQTESWVLCTATQTQDLPAELQGTGVLKMGVSTRFNDNILPEKENRSPLEIAKAYLHQQNLFVEIVNNNTVKTFVEGKNTEWDAVIFNNDKQKSIIVYSVFPNLIPEEFRTEVANMLIKTNYQLGVGAFEMDTDDGELRFRTAICYGNGAINSVLFENMFSINIKTIDTFIKEIQEKITTK